MARDVAACSPRGREQRPFRHQRLLSSARFGLPDLSPKERRSDACREGGKGELVPGLSADRGLSGRNHTGRNVGEQGLQPLEETRHFPKYPSSSSRVSLGAFPHFLSLHIKGCRQFGSYGSQSKYSPWHKRQGGLDLTHHFPG